MSGGIDTRRYADSYSPQFGLNWTPRLTREQLEQMSVPQMLAYGEARKQAEQWADDNPVGSGWVLPSWRTVMNHWQSHRVHVICGGNRSSKSSLAARLCVWALGTIPEAEVRCYHVNGDRSKQDQQRVIWESLPRGLKNMPTKRSAFHSISYSQANGFTNDILIVPPLAGWSKGGRVDFGNYASYANNQQVAEGFKAHVVWLDEEAPVALFKTLMQRTTDYHGRIILTFTVLQGWSPLVAELLGKVRTLEWAYAPLLKRKVPILQESLQHEGMLIHFFHTENNPFIDVSEFHSKMKGLPEDEILARAYGIPTKAAKAAFPLFSRDVHVVKHEDLPWIKREREALKLGKPLPAYPVTRYMAIDPAGARSWFMLWVAVDAAGTWWVYREWPDHATYGEWALPGPTVEGKQGPAQKSLGYGISDYVALIKELEQGEQIFERLIDPRMGAAEKQSSDEGATTIISDLDKHDLVVVPAPGVDVENGIQMLQGLLSFKPDQPRDSLNSPKLFVSDRCENFIYSMAEIADRVPSTAALKDPVDCGRYLAVSNIMYVAPEDMQARGGGGSY